MSTPRNQLFIQQDRNYFANLLYQARTRQGVKRRDVIEKLLEYGYQIAPWVYRDIELGNRNLTFSEFLMIADVLNLDIFAIVRNYKAKRNILKGCSKYA